MAAVPAPIPIRSFASKYADIATDPYLGDYAAPMSQFSEDATRRTANQLHQQVRGMDTAKPNAYIGMFAFPNEEAGRSMVFHGITPFPQTFGVPSPWDDKVFAFAQDVTPGGDIMTVEFVEEYFARSLANDAEMNVPDTLLHMDALLSADLAVPLLGPFDDNAVEIRKLRTRNMMFVPPAYLPIVIGRRLTPRQLYTELAGAIRADNKSIMCAPLIKWIFMTLVREEGVGPLPSPVLQAMPILPFADPVLLSHRRQVLLHQLPDLDPTRAQPADTLAAHTQLINFVGTLVSDQQLARQAMEDRAIAADARRAQADGPKLPREELQASICHLCGVDNIEDAPMVYHRIANCKKMDRQAVQTCFNETAVMENAPAAIPVVTPELSKKIAQLLFGGNNIDDLEQGLSPFSLIPQDHSNEAEPALHLAGEYDDLMGGSFSTTLEDLRKLRQSTKALVPSSHDWPLVKAQLQAFWLTLILILGTTHLFTNGFKRFLTAYLNREHFFQQRLTQLKLPNAPALFIRVIQLHSVNWFREALSTTTGPLPPVPDFQEVLRKLSMTEASWVPTLPAKYLGTPPAGHPPSTPAPAPAPAPRGGGTGGTGGGTGGGQRTPAPAPGERTAAATNDTPNAIFRAFDAVLQRVKLTDRIGIHGPLPSITRDGQTGFMCGSYHLRNRCFANCGRKADHFPHSPAEDAALLAWCQVALLPDS